MTKFIKGFSYESPFLIRFLAEKETLSSEGHVQLIDSVSSTSDTLAPTAKALKSVNDLALTKAGASQPGMQALTLLNGISSERDVNIAKKRYMQLSKEELVNRLIAVEKYVAENQERWVTNQFEQFK